MLNNFHIPVYIINLADRRDRLAHILQQFADRSEFYTTTIEAYKHEIGAFGLWESIKRIMRMAIESIHDVIIICEDDHIFTSNYLRAELLSAIDEAHARNADILVGGVSWFTNALPICENLYWVEKFSGLQFTVIFRKFYRTILHSDFGKGDAADYRISELTDKKYFVFPFISAQKEFGYSDVTPKNNGSNRVEVLFQDAARRAEAIKQVINYYQSNDSFAKNESLIGEDFPGITISAYIISPPTRVERDHIISEFEDRLEFNISFIEPYTHENDVIAYWFTIQEIVKQAMANDDDVIVICDSDHQFTNSYSRDQFIRYIINLHKFNIEMFCGGIDDFDMVVPVATDKFWIGAFKASPFLIFYKTVFPKILRVNPNGQSIRELFRNLTSNKILLYPFISTRKAFNNLSPSGNYTSTQTVTSRLERLRNVALSSNLI